MFVLEFIFGNLFIIYSIVLIILSPGTFLDNLTSFSNIWAFVGLILIYLSVYRLKHGYSFWSRIKKLWKRIFLILAGTCLVFALINLILILTPRTINLKTAENLIVQTETPESIFFEEEEFQKKLSDYEKFLSGRTFVFLLGGGIDKNGRLPKPVLRRVEMASAYLKLNPEAVCVVTGGTLKWLPYPEAPEIKRQLVKQGISTDRIFVEDQALDTIQNLQLGTELLTKELEINADDVLENPVVLVSSFYHLRRSERLARRMGFENVTGLGAPTPVFYIPMSYLREICAYVKLNARILFTGKPEKISE